MFSLAMPPVSIGLLIALSLWTSALAQGPATPVISELLESNSEGLKDEDSESATQRHQLLYRRPRFLIPISVPHCSFSHS